MEEIESLKKDIASIKERNKRVEREKAWETSGARKLIIVGLTYLVMTLVFMVIEVDKPYINAIIPTLGYALSTFSFQVVKRWWIAKKS
jgi:hypothetical protein